MEKYYWIIKSNENIQFEQKLDASTESEAVELYRRSWDKLHSLDKKRYIVYDLVYLEQSEDGEYPNLDDGYTPIMCREDLLEN